jgi:hypothetical protein
MVCFSLLSTGESGVKPLKCLSRYMHGTQLGLLSQEQCERATRLCYSKYSASVGF